MGHPFSLSLWNIASHNLVCCDDAFMRLVDIPKEVLENNFRWNNFWTTLPDAPSEEQGVLQEGLRQLHTMTFEMSANIREIYEGKIAFLAGVNKILYVHSIVAVLRNNAGLPLEQVVLTAPITAEVFSGAVELPYLFTYSNYVTGAPQHSLSDQSRTAPRNRQQPRVELIEETTEPATASKSTAAAQTTTAVRSQEKQSRKREQPTARSTANQKRQVVCPALAQVPSAPAPAPAAVAHVAPPPAPLFTDETGTSPPTDDSNSADSSSAELPPLPPGSQEMGTHPLRVSWRYKERPARVPRKPWDYNVTCFAFSKAQYWN